MRSLCLFVFMLIVGFQCLAQTSNGPSKGPIISFRSSSYDFGDMVQGAKVDSVYHFLNAGTEPLIISEVITTCGCTATKWSKEAILPGKSGEIQVTFNSEGKEGRQNKVITILSNATNSPSKITLVTNVIPPVK